MSYENNQEEEVEIISVREEQIKELIRQFLNNEKALSFSSLKAFAESPAEFCQYILREKKTTPAMQWGVLIHCLILEPEKFEDRFFILDDHKKCEELINGGAKSPRATGEYKKWRAEILYNNPDKEMLTIDLFNKAVAIANGVTSNRAVAPILEACTESEVHVEWVYKNIKFRGYIDKRTPPGAKVRIKLDLKTCRDANPKKFQREIIENKHHVQQAMYGEADPGDEFCNHYLIAIDQKGGCSIHRLDPTLMEAGLKEYDRLIDGFNKCLLTDSFNQSYDFWCGNKSGIYEAQLPAWMQ